MTELTILLVGDMHDKIEQVELMIDHMANAGSRVDAVLVNGDICDVPSDVVMDEERSAPWLPKLVKQLSVLSAGVAVPECGDDFCRLAYVPGAATDSSCMLPTVVGFPRQCTGQAAATYRPLPP